MACVVGAYNDQATGTSGCTACAAGRYGAVTSAGTSTVCTTCVLGGYSALTAASTCTACSAGAYGSLAAASTSAGCTACATGAYNSLTTGSSGCTACAIGTYSALAAASTPAGCTACTAGGYSSLPGAIGCTACSAGAYSATAGATTSAVCVACGVAAYSAIAGATAAAACTACGAGAYSSQTGASGCTACAAGAYSTAAGASSSAVCVACAAGKYGGVAPGATSLVCTACGVGTYSLVAGLGACTVGGCGAFCNCLGTAATTAVGTTVGGNLTWAGAALCSATVSAAPTRLYVVDLGPIWPGSGTLSFDTCTAGYDTVLFAGVNSVTGSASCPAAQAATGTGWCASAAGYSDNAPAQCASAPLSSFVTFSPTDVTTSFWYVLVGGAGAASGAFTLRITYGGTCQPGYYNSGGGCTVCPLGSYCPGNPLYAAYLCPPGTYGLATGLTTAACSGACPAGTFGATPGLTSPTCTGYCAAGTYANATGSTSCAPCDRVFVGYAGNSWGGTWPAWSLQPTCAVGYGGFFAGAASCSATTGAQTRPTSCSLCSAGTYKDVPLTVQCIACPVGAYGSASGLTTQVCTAPCNTGGFSTATGLTADTCTYCAAYPAQGAVMKFGYTSLMSCAQSSTGTTGWNGPISGGCAAAVSGTTAGTTLANHAAYIIDLGAIAMTAGVVTLSTCVNGITLYTPYMYVGSPTTGSCPVTESAAGTTWCSTYSAAINNLGVCTNNNGWYASTTFTVTTVLSQYIQFMVRPNAGTATTSLGVTWSCVLPLISPPPPPPPYTYVYRYLYHILSMQHLA